MGSFKPYDFLLQVGENDDKYKGDLCPGMGLSVKITQKTNAFNYKHETASFNMGIHCQLPFF